MKNNNQEYYKFLGKLYDTLLNDEIIKSDAKSNDLKEMQIQEEHEMRK